MLYFLCILILFLPLEASVKIGLEQLLTTKDIKELKSKRVGIVINQASVTPDLKNAYETFLENQERGGYTLVALFTPEHGLFGTIAAESEKDHRDKITPEGIPVYNLYGVTRWSTMKLLEKVDILVYDIQDIGCRSYTYASTLFTLMEEMGKAKKPLIILDRPNPMNGLVVDGPMVSEGMNCFASYIDIPYCHGMTIGELATYFNEEYAVGCPLKVIWMEGWKRSMSFDDTELPWVPLSPNVPSAKTSLFYPMTGFIGEIPLVNNGIGTSLPFQVVGAPWLDPNRLKNALEKQKLPGVAFYPFHFVPMKGRLMDTECHGLLIVVTDHQSYKPATTGLAILGLLKSLYPAKVKEALTIWPQTTEKFSRILGSKTPVELLLQEPYPTWKLLALDKAKREQFLTKRKKYLHY